MLRRSRMRSVSLRPLSPYSERNQPCLSWSLPVLAGCDCDPSSDCFCWVAPPSFVSSLSFFFLCLSICSSISFLLCCLSGSFLSPSNLHSSRSMCSRSAKFWSCVAHSSLSSFSLRNQFLVVGVLGAQSLYSYRRPVISLLSSIRIPFEHRAHRAHYICMPALI